jgi:hypothetical protein
MWSITSQADFVDVFGSSGRYSPPGQLFLEMKMSRSQRKPLNSSKKPQKKLEDPRREVGPTE